MKKLCIILTLCLGLSAQAQEAFNDRTVAAVFTSEPPDVDGLLDDPAWASAEVFSNFHQVTPDEYADPSELTEVRVLYDAEYLYISARVHYSDMDMLTVQSMTPQQRVFLDDRIYIMLDPFMSRRNGYLFEANAFGIQGDALLENNSQRINEWTGVFIAETSRDESGWSVEFRIPFSTVSFDPQREDWGFNVFRDLKRTTERLAWSSQGRQDLLEAPGAAGTLTGLKGLKQGLGLDLIPSVSLTNSKDFVTGVDESGFEPSLDVTYRITPSLTGKLTLNTDFSATEVDDRQVNQTRFSLFFPEKRDFFLQDAGTFEFAKLSGNGRPFFSRTIGLTDDGEPLNLNAGAKLTGRVGDYGLGFLGVQQESSELLGRRNLFVGRVVRNLLEESSLGVMVTDGDPKNDREAQTIGVDFRYRNSKFMGDQVFQGEVWLQETDNGAIPGEESSVGGDNSAWGIHAQLPNDIHNINAWIYEFGADFDPALGFANRTGIRDKRISYRHRFRPEGSYWQNHDQQLFFRWIDSTTDREKSHAVDLTLWEGNSRKGDEFKIYVHRDQEVLVEGFDLFDKIYVPPGDYEYTYWGGRIETARYRKLQLTADLQIGDFLNGTREFMSMGVNWNPAPRYKFTANWSSNEVKLPTGEFTARVISLKSQIAFTSKWSFVPLFQFDNVSEELGINLRLRFHPSRGSDMYFVWSRNMLRDLEDRFQSNFQESVIKGTYVFRF